MVSAFTAILVAFASIATGGSDTGATQLVEVIGAIQSPMKNYTCEFEGTIHYLNPEVQKRDKLREDGLGETFSGVFIWKAPGDISVDALHQKVGDGSIIRQFLVVNTRTNRAEQLIRLNDLAVGSSTIDSLANLNANQPGCFGQIFLGDEIRMKVNDANLSCSVSDEKLEGRPIKTLSITNAGFKEVLFKYWIDLDRGGQVLRREVYALDGSLGNRVDVGLIQCKMGDEMMWVPKTGTSTTFESAAGDGGGYTKQVSMVEVIYAVGGTTVLNVAPPPGAFSIKYKPGTPISDNLRKMTIEFGRQKIGNTPTMAEARKMLDTELALAIAQRSELVAADKPTWRDWSPFWPSVALAGLLLALVVAIAIRRTQR